MRTSLMKGAGATPLVLALLAGCQSRDVVITGKWKASAALSRAAAFQAQSDKTSAGPSAAPQAGGLTDTTAIDLRKDNTFELTWQGRPIPGTWTFNKESGQVQLKLASAPGQQPFETGTWVAYLSQDNSKLRLYTVGPEVAEMVKKGEGPLSNGIVLEKEAD